MTAPTPPAGWYPHPSGAPGYAWWTGSEWTFPATPATPVVVAEKKAAKEAANAAKEQAKAEQKEEKDAAFADDLARAGALIASGTFGGKTIHIHRNGYVRVAMFMRQSVKFQKLIGIETSADITKKTGAGRAAGAALTMGMNLMSSNKRGDVYLTIVTEETAYALHDTPSMGSPMTAHKLAAAGSAVIRQSEQSAPGGEDE